MTEKKKILFVDDMELFLELEQSLFSRDEIDMLVARNGQEALEAVRRERPQLVFMDLFMPVMNGDEACRQIKSDPLLQETPVVMVTSTANPDDLKQCRGAGCDDIVNKPLDRHQILEVAARHLHLDGRQAPRIPARMRVSLTLDGEREVLANYSVNLSTGGIFLETDRVFAQDTPLHLDFILDGPQRRITCAGRIAWVNSPGSKLKPHLPSGLGIQFVGLRLEDVELLRQYIQPRCITPFW